MHVENNQRIQLNSVKLLKGWEQGKKRRFFLFYPSLGRRSDVVWRWLGDGRHLKHGVKFVTVFFSFFFFFPRKGNICGDANLRHCGEGREGSLTLADLPLKGWEVWEGMNHALCSYCLPRKSYPRHALCSLSAALLWADIEGSAEQLRVPLFFTPIPKSIACKPSSDIPLNHKILWFGRDLQGPSGPTPCTEQGHQQLHQCSEPLQPELGCLQGWGTTTSLGNLCRCLTTL